MKRRMRKKEKCCVNKTDRCVFVALSRTCCNTLTAAAMCVFYSLLSRRSCQRSLDVIIPLRLLLFRESLFLARSLAPPLPLLSRNAIRSISLRPFRFLRAGFYSSLFARIVHRVTIEMSVRPKNSSVHTSPLRPMPFIFAPQLFLVRRPVEISHSL